MKEWSSEEPTDSKYNWQIKKERERAKKVCMCVRVWMGACEREREMALVRFNTEHVDKHNCDWQVD